MDVTKLQLLEDRLLVKPDPVSDKFEGSRLIKPDTVKAGEKANRGTILAVGPGRDHVTTGEFVPQKRLPGERILFGHYAGVDFEEKGEKYKIMRPDDVFAVLPNDKPPAA